ncbi:hypothetical protein [Aeromonas veronii]|uniref:hypothetical protein n=1 Tax=Aeromonas TaxID=642 RepID=UPI001F17D932|nr:hypothetical protein [Aeromonas veronii]MCF5868314.1 hypothetical protein [Aeromonas veronii]
MKLFLGVSFLLSIIFTYESHAEMLCSSTEYDRGYKKNLPILDEEEAIQTNNALIDGGIVICNVSLDYKKTKNNKRMRIETGTYEGVKYRIYFADGSGTIQGMPTNTLDYVGDQYGSNWSTQCQFDEIDDTHWCSLNKEDLQIGIWKDGTPFVSVGHSHYPNSNIAIRVDKSKPVTASEKNGFTKDQSAKIIQQMKVGSTIVTRYQKWPYQTNIDTSMQLFGFQQAWTILQKIHESAKVEK